MSGVNNKYLSPAEIDGLIGVIQLDANFEILSQDSYNEQKIGVAIVATKRVKELCEAAINMAVIGYGNKRYGAFRVGDNVIDIAQLLASLGVKINLNKDSKLKEEDLTPSRLCRFFRNHIRAYILASHNASYLWRKYTDRDPAMAPILFRGCEFLDDLTQEQVATIREAYRRLDLDKGATISTRVTRVFEAKAYVPRKITP